MSEDRLSARPLFLFSFAFFLGGIIFVDLPFVFLITTSVVSLLSLLSQIFLKIGKNVKKLLFPVLFGILLSLVIVLCTVNAEKRSAEATVGKSDICEIEITTVGGTSPNFGSYYGRVISGNASKGLRVALTAQDGSLKPGDIIKCPTTFEKPSEEEIQRLSAQKIFLSCTVSDITYVGNNDSFSITRLFESINSRLSARLKIYGGGALARAVLLGDKDELKLDVRRDFSRLGISHLLAVSGLHLSLIVTICEKLMNKCGVSKKNCSIVKVPLIVFYMGVTGFSSSVLRAGVMHLIKTAGDFVDRRSDPLTSLGAAVTLITVFDPYAFYDIGLILSALSAYACITFSFINKSRESSISSLSPLKKLLQSSISVGMLTVWITANTLPVSIRYFGNISLISPITNVLYIPAVTLLLYLALIHTVICKVPFFGALSGFLLSNTETLICKTVSKISGLPLISMPIKGDAIFVLSILFFVCIAFFPLVGDKCRRFTKVSGYALVAVIALLIGVVTLSTAVTNDILYVTSGKNEGFVVRDGLDYTLIDISDGSKKMAYTMYCCAVDENASEIENVILTHLHSKHVASLTDLTGRTIVRNVLIPQAENDADRDSYEKIVRLCREKGIEVHHYMRKSSESFSCGDVTVSFHNYTKLSRSTHPVVTFEFSLDGKRYLYGGGSRTENAAFNNAVSEADTVFIGNHHPKTKDFTLPEIKHVVVSAKEVCDELNDVLKSCDSVVCLPESGIFRSSDRSIKKVEK